MKFSVWKILWRYFLNYFINNGTPRQEQFLFRLLSLKCTLLYSSKDREMSVTDTHFRCYINTQRHAFTLELQKADDMII